MALQIGTQAGTYYGSAAYNRSLAQYSPINVPEASLSGALALAGASPYETLAAKPASTGTSYSIGSKGGLSSAAMSIANSISPIGKQVPVPTGPSMGPGGEPSPYSGNPPTAGMNTGSSYASSGSPASSFATGGGTSGGGYSGFANNFTPYTRTVSTSDPAAAYRNSLLSNMNATTKAQAEAKAANEARYKEGMDLWDQIAGLYAPGGSFGQGAEAMMDRTRTRSLAGAEQGLISSGLGGTTLMAGLPKKYEEEVGMPAKLQLEDLKTSKYAEALTGKAGFLERRTDAYPDISQMLNLLSNMYAKV